jgi:putative effector of murein hydrolase
MAIQRQQFSIWQLMKAITLTAVLTYALLPLIRRTDLLLADPVLILTVLVIAMLLNFPSLPWASWIDCLLGVKPNQNDH